MHQSKAHYCLLLSLVSLISFGCSAETVLKSAHVPTFDQDISFMKEHIEILLLSDLEGLAQIAIAPGYQGRVMTSTAQGVDGPSYGWINREAIQSGDRQPHINVFGGEDRFWLGPEGGQYSIFFPPDSPFDLENWQTPEPIDWGPWGLISKSSSMAHFRRDMTLHNYSGTSFRLTADRTVGLVGRDDLQKHLGTSLNPELKIVAFESENRITNTGQKAWSKTEGLLSIWILGMFQPSEQTIVVIPFQGGTEEDRGPIVNDAYFGKVPADRLRVEEQFLFFRGDGKWRSKIGVGPLRAKPILGSFDAGSNLLTLVQYSHHEGITDYVNSMWEIQDKPFDGDVVNSYNDGPASPGAKPLGPFYELETSSPAAALKPGESLTHLHRTIHLQGNEQALEAVSQAVLGLSLNELRTAFK